MLVLAGTFIDPRKTGHAFLDRMERNCLVRATARLVGAALTGPSDLEMGLDDVSPSAPDWMLQAERIRNEMGTLQDKLISLKE